MDAKAIEKLDRQQYRLMWFNAIWGTVYFVCGICYGIVFGDDFTHTFVGKSLILLLLLGLILSRIMHSKIERINKKLKNVLDNELYQSYDLKAANWGYVAMMAGGLIFVFSPTPVYHPKTTVLIVLTLGFVVSNVANLIYRSGNHGRKRT